MIARNLPNHAAVMYFPTQWASHTSCGLCRVVKMLVLRQVMWIAFPSRNQGAQGSAMQVDLHELQVNDCMFLRDLRYSICYLRSGSYVASCPTAQQSPGKSKSWMCQIATIHLERPTPILLSARPGWIWPVVMPGKWGKGDASCRCCESRNTPKSLDKFCLKDNYFRIQTGYIEPFQRFSGHLYLQFSWS